MYLLFLKGLWVQRIFFTDTDIDGDDDVCEEKTRFQPDLGFSKMSFGR